MKRREILRLVGGGIVAQPLVGSAQQLPVVGFLSGRSPKDSAANVSALHRGLGELGYFDRQNVEIDFRWALGHYDQLSALAADLIRRGVTVILATGGGTSSAKAAKTATSIIPIVFVSGDEPVASGLVDSLNNPGGNVTGVNFLIGDLTAKKLELLHDLLPTAMAIGLLVNPSSPSVDKQLGDAEIAAQALGHKLVIVKAGTDDQLETAFTTLVQRRLGAAAIAADTFFNARVDRLAELAARHAMPTINPLREYVVAGGLMSYGTSITDAHRQAGLYVGRILNGDKPFNLPVFQSTKLELVINLKTARSLGLTIPPSIMVRADELIE